MLLRGGRREALLEDPFAEPFEFDASGVTDDASFSASGDGVSFIDRLSADISSMIAESLMMLKQGWLEQIVGCVSSFLTLVWYVGNECNVSKGDRTEFSDCSLYEISVYVWADRSNTTEIGFLCENGLEQT